LRIGKEDASPVDLVFERKGDCKKYYHSDEKDQASPVNPSRPENLEGKRPANYSKDETGSQSLRRTSSPTDKKKQQEGRNAGGNYSSAQRHA
jgi:hypothetical protein